MGIFSNLFKSNDTRSNKRDNSIVDDNLFTFLVETDKLYMEAQIQRTMMKIAPRLERSLFVKLQNKVNSSLRPAYFGDEKFRKTEWSEVEKEDNAIYIQKDVKFDKVNVGGKLSISVSENYIEVWTVVKNNNTFVLRDIELL